MQQLTEIELAILAHLRHNTANGIGTSRKDLLVLLYPASKYVVDLALRSLRQSGLIKSDRSGRGSGNPYLWYLVEDYGTENNKQKK